MKCEYCNKTFDRFDDSSYRACQLCRETGIGGGTLLRVTGDLHTVIITMIRLAHYIVRIIRNGRGDL